MKIYLGGLSAVEYLGDKEKEFTRSPFSPKPIVKKGDLVVLEKIHAYNLSKLLPSEWKLIDDNLVNIDSDSTLIEKIAELESYVLELEEVVSNVDLKDINDEEKLEYILNGLKTGALTFEDMSDYDKALYDNHLNSDVSKSKNDTLLNESKDSDEERLKITLDALEVGDLTLEDLSEHDRALYDNHLNNVLSKSSDGILEEKLIIGADEALSNESTLKPIEEFNNDKDKLESYALNIFGLELDKRKSFANMYKQLASALETN